MKKLMFLLVAGTMFVFTACNCGSCTDDCSKECCADESSCADDCQKACCLGCKATEGNAKCIIAEDGSMPCCVAVETAEEVVEESDAGHDHDGHDHE